MAKDRALTLEALRVMDAIDRRGSFVSSLRRFRNSSFARVGGRGRNVDYEEERVGARWVWLGREREVRALDGRGDGLDVLRLEMSA